MLNHPRLKIPKNKTPKVPKHLSFQNTKRYKNLQNFILGSKCNIKILKGNFLNEQLSKFHEKAKKLNFIFENKQLNVYRSAF